MFIFFGLNWKFSLNLAKMYFLGKIGTEQNRTEVKTLLEINNIFCAFMEFKAKVKIYDTLVI